jgi:hypothetical protein
MGLRFLAENTEGPIDYTSLKLAIGETRCDERIYHGHIETKS